MPGLSLLLTRVSTFDWQLIAVYSTLYKHKNAPASIGIAQDNYLSYTEILIKIFIINFDILIFY